MTESARVDTDLPGAVADHLKEAAPRSGLAAPIRAALWLGGLALALWLSFQWGQTTSVHNDFTQNVWLPARLLMDGANPYNPTRAQIDTALGEYSSQFTGFNSGSTYQFIYPVWMAVLFAPFGAMPLLAATAIWRALTLLLLVWSVGAILRSSNPVFRGLRAPVVVATVVTVVLSLIYRESFLTLYLGQFSVLELGMLAAIWGWLISSAQLTNKQRLPGDLLTGLAMAVLATKPQSVGLVVVLLGLWALSRRRWVIPVSAVASLALLIIVPLAAFPWSLTDWIGVVAGGQASSQVTVSASVWGIGYQWLGADSPWRAIALVLTLGVLAVMLPRWWEDLRDRRSPMPLALPLTLCVNSVVSPYMLGYEHVLLLMPALVFLAAAGPAGLAANHEAELERSRKYWRLAIYMWMAVLPFLVVAVQAVLGGKEYPAIAQSLPMLALCLLFRLQWKRNNEENKTAPFPGGGGLNTL